MKRICTVILLLLQLPAAQAQEYSYAQYNADNGLAGSVVYCGVEDKEGFLWFGTETGLSRFDGTHFKNFTTADGLPDNDILRLFADSRNRIWIMPFRNSLCYYEKGRIHTSDNDTLLASMHLEGELLGVIEDKGGNLLIASRQTGYVLTAAGKITRLKELNRVKGPEGIMQVGVNYKGQLVVLGNDSMDFGKFNSLKINVAPSGQYSVEISKDRKYASNMNTVRFFPYAEVHQAVDSLHFFWDKGSKYTAYPFKVNAYSVNCFNDSLAMINTATGVWMINYQEGKPIRHFLQEKVINSSMQDSEGNYWIMTAGEGIFRIGSFEFTNYVFRESSLENVLPVFSVAKMQNKVYAGCSKGIYWTIDPLTGQHTFHTLPVGGLLPRITCFLEMPGDGIYMGTDCGLFKVYPGGIKNSMEKAMCSVKALARYKDSIVFASNAGVQKSGFDMSVDDLTLIMRSTSVAVLENTFMVGTIQGLYRVTQDYDSLYLGREIPALNTRISALAVAGDSVLWIATYGKGLMSYQKGKLSRVITEKDGLSSNICRSIAINGNDIWVGTDKGLNKIMIHGGGYSITTYSREDGIISNIINAVYVDGSNVYAATPGGLTCFDAEKISLNSFCKLRITDVTNDDVSVLNTGKPLLFPHERNNIRVDYAGISYRSGGRITYRYRLKGLSDEWQSTTETFVSYPSLPSGDYELELMATNKFGIESDVVRIPFTVDQLLWERAWFRLSLILLGMAAIWLFIHLRLRSLKKQNNEKWQISQRMAELEQMALKAQMNPHFIFNSLNSLQHYVIIQDVEAANKFITDFSRLIRQTLDISSKTRININEEVRYLSTYLELEMIKYGHVFTYEVFIDPVLDTFNYHIPPMILQPYVENSIRHGVRNRDDKNGHIKVNFSSDEQYLVCTIADNGVGRAEAARYKSKMAIEYQSKGMTLTARRIEMLNRELASPVLIDIEDLQSDGIAMGTKVVLRFPLEYI